MEEIPTKQTNKWLALTTTSIGTLMSTLNASIVMVANPLLATEFGISMAQVQWVSTIYLIVASSSMLLLGRLGDRIGSHKLYITGVAVFTIGSLACAASGGFIPLIFTRALQGFGGALMLATSMGLLTTIFPLEQRGRAMGINVLMVGLGNVAGPVVGGLILSFTSWHYVFLLSVPFGALSFILAAGWLRSPVPKNPDSILDIKGAVFFAGAIVCLVIFISGGFEGQEWFGIGFAVCVVILAMVERRAKAPLIDFELLKNRRFALGNLITFFSYTATMMLLFQLPFFLTTVWEIPVGSIGLWMMINALTLALTGVIAGTFSDKFGALKVMLPALIGLVVSFVAALFLGIQESPVLLATVLVLMGLTSGFLNTPNNSDIMTAAGRAKASYASSFVATNRNLAFTVGTALSASVFALGTSLFTVWIAPAGVDGNAVIVEHLFSFKAVLVVCLIFVLISLALCTILTYSHFKNKKTAPIDDGGPQT